MNEEKELTQTVADEFESNDRREMLKKLGKYSAYVAPFAVMAFTKKASAASGSGPIPKAARR